MNFEDTFPLIYCLNLAKRQDRRVRCEEIFETNKLGVWRFPAVDAARIKRLRGFGSAGRYAHSLSTRLIIRRAMQLNASAVFIFEDDVILAEGWRDRLAEIKLPADWGMFYLGCQHQVRPDVVAPGLVRVHGALDTHAWGIRASHYRKVISVLAGRSEETEHLLPPADVLLARQQRREDGFVAYSVFPNLAWQAEEHTDLVGGIYSNYDADGWQRPKPNVIAGVCAEALGGRAWSHAVDESRMEVPFYEQWWDSATSLDDKPVIEAPAVTEASVSAPHPALLFLTRGDVNHPKLWEDYFEGSQPEGVSILAHAANLSAVQTEWLHAAQISERVETTWGSISLVRAMLALLRAGLADEDNTHFVFLSESCVPIRPLANLRRLLAMDGRSRFTWQTCDELAKKHLAKARRMEAVRIVPYGLGRFHSQWLLLNREAAALVAADDFTELFEKTTAPDEFYFATVLKMMGWPLEKRVARQDVTWTDWSHGGAHPRTFATVTPALAADIASSGSFFARKFVPGSGIEKYRLHEPCDVKGNPKCEPEAKL